LVGFNSLYRFMYGLRFERSLVGFNSLYRLESDTRFVPIL
jgi:hypothetical protein